MSTLSQFAGGGAPIPAGVLNGTASLPEIPNSAYVISGKINAKVVTSGSLTAATLATVLNLSGKGAISFLACSPVDATARTHRFKITLDGVVVFDATSNSVASTSRVFPAIGGTVAVETSSLYSTVVPEPLFFNTSLLVEYASSLSETDKTNIGYKYYAR